MPGYYLRLALASLRHAPASSALMALAFAVGIGASMTMLTLLHMMSGDPLPQRSAMLFYPTLDPLPPDWKDRRGTDPRDQLSWPDAMNLLRAHRAKAQAAMAGATLPVWPPQAPGGNAGPFFADGRLVTAEFFALFDIGFERGAAWSADQDRAPVVVLSHALAQRLFGAADPVGASLRLKDVEFRVVGVVSRSWHPQPLFYGDVRSARAFGEGDQFFLPLQTAQAHGFDTSNNISCWGSSGDERESDRCTWLQLWVLLPTPQAVADYRSFLDGYLQQQRAAGRLLRPQTPGLYGLMQWLRHRHVVPGDVHLQLGLALGFLAVCIVNIVGLLLARFMRRAGEVSIRRALGARRRDIFLQFAAEALAIGGAGGLGGLLIAQLGLWSLRSAPRAYAPLAHMDVAMLAATLGLALLASLLAGLLPAWRVCRIAPALQLKYQ